MHLPLLAVRASARDPCSLTCAKILSTRPQRQRENEATRLFLERELLAIADRHGAQVEVDGVIYQRHEPGIVRYVTLCGALDIERWTYREMGVRDGPTVVPLDFDAGLVERTTSALGFRIALGYAKDHMRSCEEDMTADHRCPPRAAPWNISPRPSGPQPRAWRLASNRACDGRSVCQTAPSRSRWASTARRCPWRRMFRLARCPRRAAKVGTRPTHVRRHTP